MQGLLCTQNMSGRWLAAPSSAQSLLVTAAGAKVTDNLCAHPTGAMVFAMSLDKNKIFHPEPFDRLRINSAKGLYEGYETLRSRRTGCLRATQTGLCKSHAPGS